MRVPIAFGLLGLVAVIGCGAAGNDGASSDQSHGAWSTAGSTGDDGDLTAEEVARARRGPVPCAARLPARRAGAPVDDVLGVRPGMPIDEALPFVLCSHPLLVVHFDSTTNRFNLQTFGVPVIQSVIATFAKAQETRLRSSKQILADMQRATMDRANNRARRDVEPGQSAWLVGTMGLPGEERVTDVAREEWYAEGEEPTITAVEAALVSKYGPPTFVQRTSGQHILRWAYLPDGTRLDDLDGTRCAGNAYRTAAVSFMDTCGTVVDAVVDGRRDNPAIARTLHVRSMHQADAYALIERTRAALQEREASRRREQVERARKRGAGPVL